MKAEQNIIINWKHVGCIIVAICGLVTWHISHVDGKFDKVDMRFAKIDLRFEKLEDRLAHIETNHGERLARIEGILGERALNSRNNLAANND